jgi:TP901 family phage tail tape measure protein
LASLFDLFVSIAGDNSGYKKALRDSQQDTSDFEKTVTAASGRIGDAFSSLGMKLTGAGILTAFVDIGNNFQQAEAQISRSTGLVGSDVAGLDTVFRDLYATSARSSEEIVGGLSKLAVETKLSGDALESLTRVNMAFAKVTGLDVPAAVGETQTVFKQFSISTADQSDALDVLYATMTQTGIGAGELSSQMASVGPTARSFGLSFVQTAALVGTFHEAGLQASEVTRGLNTLFAKFAEAGKDPAQSLMELIAKLHDTSTQAAAVNELIEAGFAKRAAVAMADAARRGALDIDDLSGKLEESKGKIKEVSDGTVTLTENLKKLSHEASASWETIGGPLVKSLTWVLGGFNSMNAVLTVAGAATLAPFKEGSNFLFPAAPPLPKSPPAPLAADLLAPLLGGGADMGTGGGAADHSKDWSALHLQDLKSQLDSATAAFNKLRDGVKLNPGQEEQASEYIASLRKQIADLGAGITSTSNELSFNSAVIQQVIKEYQSRYQQLAVDAARAFVNPFDISKWATEASAGADAIAKSFAPLTGPDGPLAQILSKTVWDDAQDAIAHFGITSAGSLQKIVDKDKANYDAMNGWRNLGLVTANELDIAFTKYCLHQIDLNHALGYTTDAEYASEKKQAEEGLAELEGRSKQTTEHIKADRYDLAKETENMAHRTFDSMERGLAADIVQWKGWSDTVKSIGQTFATDMLSIMLKGFFKPVEDQFAALSKSFGGWLSGVLGTGSSVVPGAAGAATSAGGAASGAGGVASAASSGLTGILTSVFTGVSAVTGVIGAFQNAHQETSLNAIEHNTRYLQIEAEKYFQVDEWARHTGILAKMDMIFNRLGDVGGFKGGGGGGGNNVSIYCYNLQDLVTELKTLGVIPA